MRVFCLLLLVWLGQVVETAGQSPPPVDEAQAALAERFDRLELLAGRLAELSRSTQPRRAKLLRRLVAQSRTRDVPGEFQKTVDQLKVGQLGGALERQEALLADLNELLELLLEEDRDRQIESQRKRIARYLKELNKVIRLQRGVAARTEGGDDPESLSDDQQRAADSTEKLREQIQETETAPSDGASAQGESSEASGVEGQSAPTEDQAGDSAEGDQGEAQSPESESSESESSESQAPEGQSAEGQSAEGQSPDGQSSEGQSSDGTPGESSPSGSPSAGGQPSQSGGQSPEGQNESAEPETPAERAVESLKQARQQMEEAQRKLDEAERSGAADKQQEALRELERAKAELEAILRQLREEELERLLVLLEARFRKMLEAQIAVYEKTQELDEAQDNAPVHELEIAGGRLRRQEEQIVRQADQALMLLREDGTSAAFPEAIRQARADMETIARRLGEVKTGLITQALEEDVIAALEESLAALQQALSDLREQQSSEQQASGEPGEQPLVDRLAELRMIRALQVRVNRRTERYGALIEGEQAYEEELIEALELLAEREARILEATHDLHTGENQ